MITKKFIVDLDDKVFYMFGNPKYGIIVKAFIDTISITKYGTLYKTTNAKIIAIKTKDKKINEALKIGQSVVGWSFYKEEYNEKWFTDKDKLKESISE